jgi:hypothetical protein
VPFAVSASLTFKAVPWRVWARRASCQLMEDDYEDK